MSTLLPSRLFCLFLLIAIPGVSYCCDQFTGISASPIDNCDVKVSWTYVECSSGTYYVQYSNDGSNYYVVGQVSSNGSGSYSYMDAYAHPAGSGSAYVYYRIVFLLASGTPVYSTIAATSLGSSSCTNNATSRCNSIGSLTISGANAICPGVQQSYSLSSASYLPVWTISTNSSLVSYSVPAFGGGVNITNSSNSNLSSITLNATVEGCKTISQVIGLGTPGTPDAISPATEEVPPASIGEFFSMGANYWTVTNGTIFAGQGTQDIGVNIANVKSGYLTVKAYVTNVCGTSSAVTASYPIVPGAPNPFSIRPSLVSAPEASKLDLLSVPVPAEAPVTKVGLYPNPTSGSVLVMIPGTDFSSAYIKLFDLNGRLVKMVIPTGQRTLVDLSGQATGTYFVVIFDGKKVTSHKLVRK